MHVSARESLDALDGELQCIAWVACLPVAGQTSERGPEMLDTTAVAAYHEASRLYSIVGKAMGTRTRYNFSFVQGWIRRCYLRATWRFVHPRLLGARQHGWSGESGSHYDVHSR